MAAYAVGMMAPGLIFGSSITGTSGGRMLETLRRLMLPMPAASSALSKALRVDPPSAWPAVAAAIVTVFVIRSSFSPPIVLPVSLRRRNSSSKYRAVEGMQEKTCRGDGAKSCSKRVFFLQSQKVDHTVSSVSPRGRKFFCREQRDEEIVAGEVR